MGLEPKIVQLRDRELPFWLLLLRPGSLREYIIMRWDIHVTFGRRTHSSSVRGVFFPLRSNRSGVPGVPLSLT